MPVLVQSKSMQLPLNGKSIEVAFHAVEPASDTILLLHEALGSVTYWKDFPQKLALAAGANVLVYSRPGHGNSEGPLEERSVDHYSDQVEVVIPELLRHFSVNCPVLYGHSEGAAIAMLYAATSTRVKAIVLESPIVNAAKSSSVVIERMAAEYQGSKLQSRLGQYHRDADAVFYAWVDWAATLEDGQSFLPGVLPRIICPVLVLQGANDEFGSTKPLRDIQAALPDVQHETYANTGHLPHREQTELVLERVARFLAGVDGPASGCEPFTVSNLCEEQP